MGGELSAGVGEETLAEKLRAKFPVERSLAYRWKFNADWQKWKNAGGVELFLVLHQNHVLSAANLILLFYRLKRRQTFSLGCRFS